MVEIAARTNEPKPYGKHCAARGTFAMEVVAAGGSSTGCDNVRFVDVNSDHNDSQRQVKHRPVVR